MGPIMMRSCSSSVAKFVLGQLLYFEVNLQYVGPVTPANKLASNELP